MTDHTIDEVQLKRWIVKAGQGYELARVVEQDADEAMAKVQRLMDYAGLDRFEADQYIVARPKKGSKIRLEKKP